MDFSGTGCRDCAPRLQAVAIIITTLPASAGIDFTPPKKANAILLDRPELIRWCVRLTGDEAQTARLVAFPKEPAGAVQRTRVRERRMHPRRRSSGLRRR